MTCCCKTCCYTDKVCFSDTCIVESFRESFFESTCLCCCCEVGGLGSAVAEVVCEEYPVPVVKVGVEDKFGASGPAVEMLKIYGLCASNIVEKAKKAISMK